MPELSYNQFRERAIAAQIEEHVKRQRYEPKKRQAALLTPEIKIQEVEEKILSKSDGRTRTTIACPQCGRKVKCIDGRILSHRQFETESGLAFGVWCVNGEKDL